MRSCGPFARRQPRSGQNRALRRGITCAPDRRSEEGILRPLPGKAGASIIISTAVNRELRMLRAQGRETNDCNPSWLCDNDRRLSRRVRRGSRSRAFQLQLREFDRARDRYLKLLRCARTGEACTRQATRPTSLYGSRTATLAAARPFDYVLASCESEDIEHPGDGALTDSETLALMNVGGTPSKFGMPCACAGVAWRRNTRCARSAVAGCEC